MGAGGGHAPAAVRPEQDERADARELTPAEAAWIAAVPCGLLILAAVVLLGPVVGRTFFSPTPQLIFPGVEVRAEPTEHARYALALLAPLLLVAAVAVVRGRGVRLPAATTRALVTAGQVATFGLLVYCLLALYRVVPGAVLEPFTPPGRFFKPPTLAAAAVFTVLVVVVLRRATPEQLARWVRETVTRRRVAFAFVGLYTALWMMRSLNTDATVVHGTSFNLIPWEMSEPLAVLNGRTPLVDFHAMYSHLWSYPFGAAMGIAGASVATWTASMTLLSGLALLAVYAIFRRVAGSSLLALGLFVPFLALSMWTITLDTGDPFSVVSVYSMWPLRYAAPYLLAWMIARHVGGAAPRRAAVVFGLAGLALVNNLEFGLAAFAATLVAFALVAASDPRPRQALGRLLVDLLIGLAGAATLIAVLTLVLSGRLPNFAYVLEFPRLFANVGWGVEPMPWIGLHIAMYATFVAAIAMAAVRVLSRSGERVLTVMLGWAGTFGLLAGTYYLGRSNPGNLILLLSTWGFCLVLLLVVVLRALAAGARRPTLPELAVIFGFGLGLASLATTPLPWEQVTRLRDDAERIWEQPEATRFVAERTRPGERVAIFAPLGSRIAHDLDLENVSPYVSLEAIRTPTQLRTALDAVDREGVHRVFLKTLGVGEESGNVPAVLDAFTAAGFSVDGEETLLISLSDLAPVTPP